jgi:hypothetical protein
MHEDKVTHRGSQTEITKGAGLPHRWDIWSCEYNEDILRGTPFWRLRNRCTAMTGQSTFVQVPVEVGE